MVKEWLPQNNWKNEWKQWPTQKHQAKNGLLASNLDTYPVYVISPPYSPFLWKFRFNFCFQTFSALSLCAKTINACDSCANFDSTLVFKHLFGEATWENQLCPTAGQLRDTTYHLSNTVVVKGNTMNGFSGRKGEVVAAHEGCAPSELQHKSRKRYVSSTMRKRANHFLL